MIRAFEYKKVFIYLLTLVLCALFHIYSFASAYPIPDGYQVSTSGNVIPVRLSGNMYQFCYSKTPNYLTTPLVRGATLSIIDNRYQLNSDVGLSYESFYGYGYSPIVNVDLSGKYVLWCLILDSAYTSTPFIVGLDNDLGFVDVGAISGITYLNINDNSGNSYLDYYYWADSSNDRLLYIASIEPIETNESAFNIGLPTINDLGAGVMNRDSILYGYYSDNPFVTAPPPTHDEIVESKLDNIQGIIQNLQTGFQSSLDWLSYNVTNNISGLPVGSTHTLSVDSIDEEGESITITKTYNYPEYTEYNFRLGEENVLYTTSSVTGTYLGILHRKYNEMLIQFNLYVNLIQRWFYPLRNSSYQYWRVWDTDTDSYKSVNPATVTGYITWYLGKLYEHLTADTDSILSPAIDDTKNAITSLEQTEKQITDTYIPAINNFNPSSIDLGSLSAVSFVGNYLQRIFTALGAFNIPIIAALTLAVCMQLVGYFKYK